MIRKILVAVDLEDEALMARMLQFTGELAGLHNADISLIHVVTDLPANVRTHLPADYEKSVTEEVAETLNRLLGSSGLPAEQVHVIVRIGSVYREVLDQAGELGADLIVIGCHRPDVADYLLGSNAARVVRRASSSVFVVR